MTHPKVFLSHAGEDKERFVVGFAERLRSDGVDAWLDYWEMLPGDSLVDKVFEEGIGKADAFIVILSNNSIKKNWVKEELNAGMVRKIEGKSKLIPIVIDDCEVPQCLKPTIWERINDLSSYDSEYNRILHSIFGMHYKPNLGSQPAYTAIKIDTLPGLNAIDTRVLVSACEYAIEKIITYSLQTSVLSKYLSDSDLSEDEILESLQVLESMHFVKLERVLGGKIPCFDITHSGLSKCLRSKESEYSRSIDDVCLCLINEDPDSSHGIADSIGVPLIVINHILEMLSMKNLVKINIQLAYETYILNVSPRLRRMYV